MLPNKFKKATQSIDLKSNFKAYIIKNYGILFIKLLTVFKYRCIKIHGKT